MSPSFQQATEQLVIARAGLGDDASGRSRDWMVVVGGGGGGG